MWLQYTAEVGGNLTRLISTGRHIRLASNRPLLSDHDLVLITSHRSRYRGYLLREDQR